MPVEVGTLPGVEYHRHPILQDGPIRIDAFFQARVSGESELLLVFTSRGGQEKLLKDLYENAPASNSLRPGLTTDPLVRITKGWSQWPGDARAEIPLQAITLYVLLPQTVRSVTLDLPDLSHPIPIDVESFKEASTEVVTDGWSFGYARLAGLTLARITHYDSRHDSDPAFRVETQASDWGAQYHSLDDRVEVRIITARGLAALERYRISASM